ncbi:RrF2 family transcriptional regulator [Desulfobaculum bizertense]|uniref:Transcriptional regulator, BadM/Rrf2 family n=1 Tax=Desulfobaculum bizertense DSM 18034 TaxID=1121442 RepID=A0A1T4VKJ9_9BACT|nr:Rrf2 family transcriptional regulator [Desulfobaculum bizertense]UIJ38078.1 Rrf2 family transcriptional regulator [Desulfobaculum bizertense]SKA65456.1 transcriptional regulator, BadM/Rrf2 family [Desulfobaculum bizertense DSM 18034]
MKLSTRSRYGTRMLIDIALHSNGRPVSVSDISKRLGVSVKYLEQLIRPLKRGGYLDSVRGPKGGHMLTRSPEEITVGEVVRLLEGGINLTECVAEPDKCERAETCSVRDVWVEATRAMNSILDSMTLSQISHSEGSCC